MKKRVVAVALSMAMCISMAAQAGASALDDGVLTDGVAAESTMEPSVPEEGELLPSDILDSGEVDVIPEMPEMPEAPAAPEAPMVPEEPQQPIVPEAQDVLQGAVLYDSTDVPEAGENGEFSVLFQEPWDSPDPGETTAVSVVVGPERWIKMPQGFKLVKQTSGGSAAEEEPVPLAVQEMPVAGALSSGEEEALPSEETTPAEAVPSEEASPVEESLPVEEEVQESVQETEETAAEGVGAGEAGISTEAAAAGKTFYTSADGILKVTTTSVKGSHTGYYYFDENGIMVTGKKEINGEEYYFAKEVTASLYEEYTGVAKTPVTSDLGQMKKNCWLYESGKFRFYDKAGKNVPISVLNEQNKATGYIRISNRYFLLRDDGTPRTGFIGIKGSKYFFDPETPIPGQMYMNGWRCMGTNSKGEKWIYFNRENKGADKGKAIIHKGNVALTINPKGNVKYLLDHNGYILKNRHTKCKDGAWYGSDSEGRIVKDAVVRYGKNQYYFTKSGKQVGWRNMWKQCPTPAGKRYFYFGNQAGCIVEKRGWQKVTWPSGKFLGWFYFRNNGDHYAGRWVGNQYFDSVGRLVSGIKTIGGKTYFFEISDENTHRGRAFRNTMIKYKDRWYYAKEDGQLANNEWRKINGSWYYFENLVSLRNTFRWMGDTYGWLDEQGKFCTGWVVLSNSSNKVRYVNPNGNGFYKNTSAVIDGLRYYFDEKAYRINDLTGVYRGPYYVEVDRVNGLMTIFNEARTVPVKSIRVSVGAPGTETPTGRYRLYRSGRWQSLMGPSWGQYGTHVRGAGLGGIFIHSIAGVSMNHHSVPAHEYNKLGDPASHGCIRACVADAKWVFENCNGARIRIFDGAYESREALKGPLGRRARVPMRPPFNTDPTDPAV